MKNIIEVWNPKYSTNEVLVSLYKLKQGDNYIRITKDKNYKDKLLKINYQDTLQFGIQQNGRGKVRVIPVIAFETVEDIWKN